MTKGEAELQKALNYLDFGKSEQGEHSLTSAHKLAQSAGDQITYIQTVACYACP